MTKLIIKILIPVLILGAGAVGTKYLLGEKEPVKNKVEKEERVFLVNTLTAKPQNHLVYVRAQGTTQAYQELSLAAEVGGRVKWINPELVAGGYVHAGELLFKIDPTDYQLLVDKAKANLATAEFELDLVKAKQKAAKTEHDSLKLSKASKFLPKVKHELSSLALYEPQLKKALSGLKSVRISLRQSMINLKRTRIFAPFSGYLKSVSLAPGQNISAKQTVATMFADRPILVVVFLPLSDLTWFHTEQDSKSKQGSRVTISKPVSQKLHTWQGVVKRQLQELDNLGRLVKVVVHISNPKSNLGLILPLGLFVDVKIRGQMLKGVISIPHTALHKDSTLWVLDNESQLTIRKTVVERRNNESYLIRGGVKEGEQIITSSLSTPIVGMPLKKYTEAKNSTEKTAKKVQQSQNREEL